MGILTSPNEIDPATTNYDFSSLITNTFGNYSEKDMNKLSYQIKLEQQKV